MSDQTGNIRNVGSMMVDIEVRASWLRRCAVAILACMGLTKMAFRALEPSIHISALYFKQAGDAS